MKQTSRFSQTVVDANYLLRWFLNDVPAQTPIVDALVVSSPAESLIIDRVTIAEITYVLRGKKYDHVQIFTLFEELFYYPSVRPLDEVDNVALELFRTTTLDFEDCIMIAMARQHGYGIATFDNGLLAVAHNG